MLCVDVSTLTLFRFYRRARDALRHCLPEQLRSPQFTACLRDDAGTRRWLVTLIQNLSTEQATNN